MATDDAGSMPGARSTARARKKNQGKKGRNGKRQPRSAKERAAELRRQEKIAEALEYRSQGFNYRQIGEAMGVAHTTARNYVEQGMREMIEEPAEEVRQMTLHRLDLMMTKVFGEFISSGDIVLIDPILKLQDRICRYSGVMLVSENDATANLAKMGATLAQMMAADKPVLRPDGPVPANPIL